MKSSGLKKPCKLSSRTPSSKYPYVNRDGAMVTEARVVLERKLRRPIREGLWALHHCDVPRCIEPTHIYEGTPQQNTRDSFKRFRGNRAKGEGAANVKLSSRKVLAIRVSKLPTSVLAEQNDISEVHVRRIRSGTTWRHL